MSEDNIIDLAEHRAIREVQEILGVDNERAKLFFYSLEVNTISKALREIGITSASQIGLNKYSELREWRDKWFQKRDLL